VRQAVALAERMAKVRVESVLLSVSGGRLHGRPTSVDASPHARLNLRRGFPDVVQGGPECRCIPRFEITDSGFNRKHRVRFVGFTKVVR
jgi:hypothetical protein